MAAPADDEKESTTADAPVDADDARARAGVAAPADAHADLEFPGDATPPVDPKEADAEAARVADAVARNRRATAAAAIVGFVVATAVFFGIAYAFPDSERGFSLVFVALSAGAFAGLGVWALGRSKAPVFDPGALPPDAPVDAETRRYEERGRAHDRQTRRALGLGGATFFLAGPVALYAWSRHLEALNETRSYFERESIGAGRSLGVLVVAAMLGALVTRLLRPRIDVLSELGGVPASGATPSETRGPALSKADVAELRAVAHEVRAQQRRDALAHGGAVIGFLVTAPLVLFVLDWLGRSADPYERSSFDGAQLLLACLAGGAVAYGISRAAGKATTVSTGEHVAPPDRGRDWFAQALGTTRSITLEVPGDFEALLGRSFGVAVNRWTLVDAGGAQLAEASEDELPLLRRFLPFRPRTISVRDLDRTPLVLTRPGGPVERSFRLVADGAPAGTIGANLLGTLILCDASGAERFRVRRSWLSRRSRVVLSAGKEVARIEWPRPGFFATFLDRPGLVVGVPDGASLADRRLLLAAGLVLDLDHA